ncbi:putative pyruvate dehydrogenase [Fasciola gigantica]|uniref:Protein-serine/threonine kinase n=1 Tax=Fasciola gigantica TaxID=46835 RepID=A0A504YQ17_FASGI|nr:putative pyruvate dehydrogenase [Fasciola gigantica]
MKVNQLFGLVGKVGLKFEAYSSFRPIPLNLKNLIEFGKTAPASKSFEFLKNELPVRIANILQEIRLLPDSLLFTKPVQEIIKMFVEF